MIINGDELIQREFSSVDLGDKRLNKQLARVAMDFVNAPKESIPQMCGNWPDTKATYRFLKNPNVTKEKILEPHRQRTIERMAPYGEILVVGDTTFFTFPHHPSKEGLGEVGNDGDDIEGVLSHNSIALGPSAGEMLGVLDQQTIIRREEETILRDKQESEVIENESVKWNRGVKNVTQMMPEEVRPTFVFDRGADDYDVFKDIIEAESGYVIRSNQNRAIRTKEGKRSQLHKWIKQTEKIGEIKKEEILVNKPGKTKEVKFSVRAGSCFMLAPHPDRQSLQDEGALHVNVVHLKQKNHAPDEEPVEWILITDKQVDTLEKIREVIRRYEHRWKIEEWHECIKDRGCKFEDRALKSWDRMERLLAVLSVVGWRLLGLRDAARKEGKQSPEKYLTEAEMRVIEQMDEKVKQGASAGEYFLGIARIGGYLDRTNDPEPGWQILWRGFKKVQTMAKGYQLAN